MRLALRRLLVWLGCAVAGVATLYVALASSLVGGSVVGEVGIAWTNVLMTVRGAPPSHPVRLLDLGAPEPSGHDVAEALDRLRSAGARAVLVSVDLGSATSADADALAAVRAAIGRHGRVVLVEGGTDDLGHWSLPEPLRQAAAAVGTRTYLSAGSRATLGLNTDYRDGGQRREHALIALMRLVDPSYALPGRAFSVEDHPLERLRDGKVLLLPFTAGPGGFPGSSLATLRSDPSAARELADRIVVVGSTLEHLVPTPYDMLPSAQYPARRMSEAELAANQAAALASGRIARDLEAHETATVLLATVLLCGLPLLLLPPIAGYVVTMTLGIATLPAWWFAARQWAVVFPDAPLALLAVAAMGLYWLCLALWATRRDMRLLARRFTTLGSKMRFARAVDGPRGRIAPNDSIQVAHAAIDEAQAHQDLVAAVIESLPIAVLLVDDQARIVAANRPVGPWFGGDDPVGRDIASVLHRLDFHGAGDAEALLQSAHRVAEARLDERHVLVGSRQLPAAGPRPLRLLTFQDVTAVKQAAMERADAVNFLTHDLRTPLNSILAVAEQMERGMQSGEAGLRQIRSVSERAIGLADNYVHLLRAAEDTSSALGELSLGDVIEEAVASVQPLARARRIALQRHETGPAFVLGDYALLYRAALNLLSNALRHAPDASAIDVRLERQAGRVALVVRDRGPGFPAELLAQPTSRFRVGKQPKLKGIGLGLALVDATARKHGGTMHLANLPDGGAEARLSLPLLGPDRDAEPATPDR